jgi:hypothetical protein
VQHPDGGRQDEARRTDQLSLERRAVFMLCWNSRGKGFISISTLYRKRIFSIENTQKRTRRRHSPLFSDVPGLEALFNNGSSSQTAVIVSSQ